MGAVDFRWLRATYMRHMVDDSNEKRLRAEILADAIKELAPQDEQEMYARLTRCMKGLCGIVARGKKAPTLAKKNQQLRARLKRMQTVRADLVAIGSPPDVIEVFDRQLRATGETAFDFSKYISKCMDGRIATVRHGVISHRTGHEDFPHPALGQDFTMITGTTARIDTARDGTVWITGNPPRLK
jgi:hypothetical protein